MPKNNSDAKAELPRFDWDWICEFCYKTINSQFLPDDWDLVWQSAVCPECQEKVKCDGGYTLVKLGAYAKVPDPRLLQ